MLLKLGVNRGYEMLITGRRVPTAELHAWGVSASVVPAESLLGDPLDVPPIPVPVLGVWSSGDRHLTERQMQDSAQYVSVPWRYERLDGVGHWMTLEAPERVSALLIDFLAGGRT